jgi:hypothetical protein
MTTSILSSTFTATSCHTSSDLVTQAQDGSFLVQQLGVIGRIQQWCFKSCRNERDAAIASAVAAILHNAPRVSPAEGLNDPAALSARQILKEIRDDIKKDPRVLALGQELLAYKLGIPASAFDSPINSGFKQFASFPPLERYLGEYGHRLQVDEVSGEIKILQNGVLQPWSSVTEPTVGCKFKAASQPWTYGPDGVQDKDMFEWTELTPYKKEDPAQWDHQYIFEFSICSADTPRKTGDHSWIRLKTPEGDIYSVGLYRPGKRDQLDNWKFPLRIKQGILMSPDVSEFWPTPIQRIPVAITKEQFLEIKREIEQNKKDNELTFQLFHGNCTLYTSRLAAMADIALPSKKPLWKVVAPAAVVEGIERIGNCLPSIVSRVAAVSTGIITNFGLLLLGASIVDARVRQYQTNVKPHIGSISDLFNPAKSELNHPHTLGHETLNEIMAWRTAETARLQKEMAALDPSNVDGKRELEKAIAAVRFGLPSKYRASECWVGKECD